MGGSGNLSYEISALGKDTDSNGDDNISIITDKDAKFDPVGNSQDENHLTVPMEIFKHDYNDKTTEKHIKVKSRSSSFHKRKKFRVGSGANYRHESASTVGLSLGLNNSSGFHYSIPVPKERRKSQRKKKLEPPQIDYTPYNLPQDDEESKGGEWES